MAFVAYDGRAAGDARRDRGGDGDALVAEESMAGLGSAVATTTAMATMTATATARERGEKYNLLHERFAKLGARLTVVLVCFAQGVGPYLLGENSSPSHQLAIWY
jgi:hypothetical protein